MESEHGVCVKGETDLGKELGLGGTDLGRVLSKDPEGYMAYGFMCITR